MQSDLLVKICNIGCILQLLLEGVCLFGEIIDKIMKQLEGSVDVGVLFGQCALVFEERVSCELVDLLDPL